MNKEKIFIILIISMKLNLKIFNLMNKDNTQIIVYVFYEFNQIKFKMLFENTNLLTEFEI